MPPTYPQPSPEAWEADQVITSPTLREQATEAIGFLAYRPLGVFANQSGTGQGVSDQFMVCPVELYDNWDGHSTSDEQYYYCQTPGWYLAQSRVPFNYTSGTGAIFAAGFNALSNGASVANSLGALLDNASTFPLTCQVCDLIPLYITGAIGGTGDYIGFLTYNGAGTTVDLENNASVFPMVTIRWVAAISGTTGLAVPANGSWPVPPSYVTSTFLNTSIYRTMQFLLYPPICKVVYTPGTTTIPSQAFPAGTVIPMGTVVVDNYSGYSTSTHAYTAPVSGNYFCYGQMNLAANATSTGYGAGFSINGGTTIWGDVVKTYASNGGGGASVTKRLQLTAGQTLQLVGVQGTGGAVEYNTTTANATRMIIVWESTA